MRIRPFFENDSPAVRRAAISLIARLFNAAASTSASAHLTEQVSIFCFQLKKNLFLFYVHLSPIEIVKKVQIVNGKYSEIFQLKNV